MSLYSANVKHSPFTLLLMNAVLILFNTMKPFGIESHWEISPLGNQPYRQQFPWWHVLHYSTIRWSVKTFSQAITSEFLTTLTMQYKYTVYSTLHFSNSKLQTNLKLKYLHFIANTLIGLAVLILLWCECGRFNLSKDMRRKVSQCFFLTLHNPKHNQTSIETQ